MAERMSEYAAGTTIYLSLGGVCLGVYVGSPAGRLTHLDKKYTPFRCPPQETTLDLDVVYGDIPEIELRPDQCLFDSGAAWSLYRTPDNLLLTLRDAPASGGTPYTIATLEPDIKRGTIASLIRDSERSPVDGLMPFPLDFPLGEVLMTCLLARGKGVMVHACGVDDGGKGYLFAGNSGHGKTTMAGLWSERARIVNDDRVILRYQDGTYWMYGTPWHGDYDGVSAGRVELAGVFFLRHGPTHRLEPSSAAQAAAMLLSRSFPPLWDHDGMKFTLDFLADLVTAVPCSLLTFAPRNDIVELITCAHSW